MADWKDILNENERPLSDDELLNFINVRTTESEKQQISDIASGDFEKDALEGLQHLDGPEVANQHVNMLKKQLQKQLSAKKQKTAASANNQSAMDYTGSYFIAIYLHNGLCGNKNVQTIISRKL